MDPFNNPHNAEHHIKHDAKNAKKLLKHFVDLHFEREKILKRISDKPIHTLKRYESQSLHKELKRNIKRDGTILKLLERDLTDMIEKTNSIAENINHTTSGTAAKDIIYLVSLLKAIEKNIEFYQDKQADYIRHEENLFKLVDAVNNYHAEERERLRTLIEQMQPDRLKGLEKFLLKTEKILKNEKIRIGVYVGLGGITGAILGAFNILLNGTEDHPGSQAIPLSDRIDAAEIILLLSIATGFVAGCYDAYKKTLLNYGDAHDLRQMSTLLHEQLGIQR